jgi:apolipoprotein N-acyltransferase
MKRALLGGTTSALLFLAGARLQPWFGWFVCAPLVIASYADSREGKGWRSACLLGAVFGLVVALGVHVPWLVAAGRSYFGLSLPRATLATLALTFGCGLPASIVLGLGLRCATLLPGGLAVIATAAVWVSWENLALICFPYYPWASLAPTQISVPSVLQVASIAGQGGVSFLLAATGAALAYAFCEAKRGIRIGLKWVACALGIVTAATLFGILRLRDAGPEAPSRCSIAAVDAGIPSPFLPASQVLERYAEASTRALAAHPDAIVWPESALPGDPALDPGLRRHLEQKAREWSAVIFAGGPRIAWGTGWKQELFNSVYRIAGGAPLDAYDKRWLVPFAEYWPRHLAAKPAWLEVAEVTPGDSAEPMRAGGCHVGLLICFESERPELARALAEHHADAIVVVSNDAQLPSRAFANEIAQLRLRAVETGLPVLRASNGGTSLAIDRYGRTVGSSANGVVLLSVGAADRAAAVRWAGTFAGACWVGTLLTIGSALRKR